MSDSFDANDILRRDGPDALRDNLDRAHAKARGNGADKTANSEPEPLTRQSAPAEPYPIGALGDVLGPAAMAIAEKVQCPAAMAAQSVLAVASLAAQGLVDVFLPFGQTRPVSLFALTIAASGDRKSSADNEAMIPVRMREKTLGETYKVLKEIADAHPAATSALMAGSNRSLWRTGPGPLFCRVAASTIRSPRAWTQLSIAWFNPDPTAARKTRRWIVAQAGEKP